ncbi:hypothetical protein EYZ11_005398 [Aspergillus tanneri]|uniref:Uncharacterized protein n=1 Tax=Aspergillus tanneri TaxID=1220188 RepID=A0A4V3UPH0_9EURO|nr:hypothetical protein EYZ11_005398 [Aspergillus tanneri]
MDSNSSLKLDSEGSDSDDEPGDNFFNDEAQLPPEHYLAEAESLGNHPDTKAILKANRWLPGRDCKHICLDLVQHR